MDSAALRNPTMTDDEIRTFVERFHTKGSLTDWAFREQVLDRLPVIERLQEIENNVSN